jgi:branched-chain amino acid transport system ATP-binding protein
LERAALNWRCAGGESAVIRIEGLLMQYGGVRAIDQLDVLLEDPVCGLIGPNGAGKTTLLNVLSGFARPQAGRVEIDGHDLLVMNSVQRARFGLRRSFQAEQVVEDLSVWDNVRAVLDHVPHGRAGMNHDIAGALDHVGLLTRSAVPGADLNQYERRMLELAKALIGQPRLLLLDEPGAGLSDPEVARLRTAISGIHQAFNAQVLLIDHDVALIAALCSQTLVLDFGRRLALGPTAAVLSDPQVKRAYLGEELEGAASEQETAHV